MADGARLWNIGIAMGGISTTEIKQFFYNLDDDFPKP